MALWDQRDTPVAALFVRVTEAARILDISKAAVYRLVGEGKIRTAKFGRSLRIPRDGLEKFIAESMRGPV